MRSSSQLPPSFIRSIGTCPQHSLISAACIGAFHHLAPKYLVFSQPLPYHFIPSTGSVLSAAPEGGSSPWPAATQQTHSNSLFVNLVKQTVSYRDLAAVKQHKRESQQLHFHNRTIIFQPHKRHWRMFSTEMGISGLQRVLFPLCTTGFQLACKYPVVFYSQDLIPVHFSSFVLPHYNLLPPPLLPPFPKPC